MDKLNRPMLVAINGMYSYKSNLNRPVQQAPKTELPDMDTFKYILEKAKTGNEMAEVFLKEWQQCCEPKNDFESHMMKLINSAVKKIQQA